METHELHDQMEYKKIINRFEYVTVYRLKDKSRVEKAIRTQDRIRKMTKGGADLTGEIRKWRDKRCF